MKPSMAILVWSILMTASTLHAFEGMWQDNGAAVCTASGDQRNPQLISDNQGGSIVVWQDYRLGPTCDLYAQRINALGEAVWQDLGIPICTESDDQFFPQLISDNNHGAIMAWQDKRSGTWKVYTQRIGPAGDPPLWPANGISLASSSASQTSPLLVPDAQGGAIIAWKDLRNGNTDIYAQRVNADGDLLWNTQGNAVCTTPAFQNELSMIADGSGGAILLWQEYDIENLNLRAQRIDASGAVLWAASGVPICLADFDQLQQHMVVSKTGGAIVTWQDMRYGNGDIFAQRINLSGECLWLNDGIAICTESHIQASPQVIPGQDGGATIAWADGRTELEDIYAQRIDQNGNTLWANNGKGLCLLPGLQSRPKFAVGLNSELPFLVWLDDNALYTQQIDANGNPLWASRGLPLCIGTTVYSNFQVQSAMTHGSFIVWAEKRESHQDIYAQKIIRKKPELSALTPLPVPNRVITPALTLSGLNFRDDRGEVTLVKLTPTAGALPVFTAADLQVDSSTALRCRFDLTALTTPASYFVLLIDSTGQTGTSQSVLLQTEDPSMQSLTWVNATAANLNTGTPANLVGQINASVFGKDTLTRLDAVNAGTAVSGTDLAGLTLWHNPTGGSFSPQAQLVGTLTPQGDSLWRIEPSLPVQNTHALYLCADIAGSAQPGRTCQFQVPAQQAVFTFAVAYPTALASTTTQTIAQSVSLQMEVIPPSLAKFTPGQTNASLLHIRLSNIGNASQLIASLRPGFQNTQNQPLEESALFSRLWLERDGQTVAQHTAPFGDPWLVFSSPLALAIGQSLVVELKADLIAEPMQDFFQAGLLDATSVNGGALLTQPSLGLAFPLLTGLKIIAPQAETAVSAYPNPYVPGQGPMKISYYLAAPGQAQVQIFTLNGNPVLNARLSNQNAGIHEYAWSGKNSEGRAVKSGVYLLKLILTTEGGRAEEITRKISVAR